MRPDEIQAFQSEITTGIPSDLPASLPRSADQSHAPVRKDILTAREKELALRNALRYFPKEQHGELAPEFAQELKDFGRIYMYRLRPSHSIFARPIDMYPAQCQQAASIMLMIQNNLDPAVAQHPEELITYGGNGGGVSKLGPVSADHAVPQSNDGGSDLGDVQRSPHGVVSISP